MRKGKKLRRYRKQFAGDRRRRITGNKDREGHGPERLCLKGKRHLTALEKITCPVKKERKRREGSKKKEGGILQPRGKKDPLREKPRWQHEKVSMA